MTKRFTQIIRFKASDPELLVALAKEYDSHWAGSDVTGFIGQRVLADRDSPGHYFSIVEFAEVDGEKTAAEEAKRNEAYNETTGWWKRFRALAEEEPEFVNADEIYRTGITGNLRTG